MTYKAKRELNLRKLPEAYRIYLETYDLAKEIFSTEINPYSAPILRDMAGVKLTYREFEEALKLIDKAKDFEKKLSSENSYGYQSLLQVESLIHEAMEKARPVRQVKWWERLLPNTPFKISVYVVGIVTVTAGVAYLAKKKHSQ